MWSLTELGLKNSQTVQTLPNTGTVRGWDLEQSRTKHVRPGEQGSRIH